MNNYNKKIIEFIGLVITFIVIQVQATEHDIASDPAYTNEQIVEYPASFFARYQPNNALDMVQQLPGFQINDGTSDRGFIGATGNILINDTYPSAKQDTPSNILLRIPAHQVSRIEVIRGQARGIDLQGQNVVANVILKDDAEVALRWEAFIQHSNTGPWKPRVNMSLSHQWKDIEYNLGINIEREANGEIGTEDVLDSSGNLIEHRTDVETKTGIRRLELFLNSKTIFADTQLQFNGKVTNMNGPEWQTSIRTPQDTGEPFEVFFKDNENRPSFELGMDAERNLIEDLDAKSIFLYTNSEFNVKNLRSNRNTEGVETSQRVSESEQLAQEIIARLEFDWTGIDNHNFQLNLEGAYNSLDGTLLQTLDTGSGPVIIDVPNGNTKVEEIRGDFAIKDTWEYGNLQLDYGLGAEVSTIKQSGDTEQERDFFFIKPQMVVNYSSSEQHLSRLIVIREVAQLDFGDFISATVFEDNDLALGNPDLRPDTTWITELSHEYRYGSLGVIKASVFHHWISDVLDLLPLSESFEAPGNIGKGRRWGISMENTIPMEWLGLQGARLDLKVRWQDSSVTDPVTGEKRILSATQVGFGGPPGIRFRDNGSDYVYNLAFRQDFEISRIAWGVDMGGQGERPRFKVNELEVFNEGMLLSTFIETTRWFDIKIRLDVTNILNYTESRHRTLYESQRDLSPVDSQIIRDRIPGRRTRLVISGSF